jgi:hypothetical protein
MRANQLSGLSILWDCGRVCWSSQFSWASGPSGCIEGFVDVIRDIFMSVPENVVELLDAEGAESSEGTEDLDGATAVSDGCGSEPSAVKGDGLRVRRRRW